MARHKEGIQMSRRHQYDPVAALERAGIAYDDATALRRIAMTLHRWYEQECGNSNEYASWVIVRGEKHKDGLAPRGFVFEHKDDGAPFEERHIYSRQSGVPDRVTYTRLPDRERGATARLEKIMAGYPGLSYYLQTDPRGAPLYILRPGDVPAGEKPCGYYSRGISVHK
jgi:hypothetical protein